MKNFHNPYEANINTTLPIVKHTDQASEPCYLLLSKITTIQPIIEKISTGIIKGIISTQENLQHFEEYANTYDIALISCTDPYKAWAYLCYKNNPQMPGRKIGISGTCGKTSTTWFINQLLIALGQNTLLINSLGIYENGIKIADTKNTTPDAELIHKYSHEFTQKHGSDSFGVYEVSSIAIEQKRIAFLDFDIALLTNFSQEHLDYHGTMQNYLQAKLKLAKQSKSFFIHNSIDAEYPSYGNELLLVEQNDKLKILLNINNKEHKIETNISGLFQAYNILSAIKALQPFFEIEELGLHANKLNSPPGRMQRVANVIIDHSHKEDALRNALQSVQAYKPKNIIVVMGCGGNRDTAKRPLIGKVMEDLADIAIITNDNPRYEAPEQIAAEIASGFIKKKPIIVLNREEAIKYALSLTGQDDICLIAGKGNETTMEIQGNFTPVSDFEIVKKYHNKQ